MKHNIRISGEVKEIDCELGSGLLDENDTDAGKVVYHHGQFWLLDEELSNLFYSCVVTVVD